MKISVPIKYNWFGSRNSKKCFTYVYSFHLVIKPSLEQYNGGVAVSNTKYEIMFMLTGSYIPP